MLGDERLALGMAHLIAMQGRKIWLYAPDGKRRARLKKARKLKSVLPEVESLHEGVNIVDDIGELGDNCRLVFFTGVHGNPEGILKKAGDALNGSHEICHAFQRLHGRNLETSSVLIREWTPCLQVGALAGPLHVSEMLQGKPNAIVVGSPFPDLVRRVQEALDWPNMRTYTSPDLLGVELSAALIQIVALAIGIADSLSAGAATRSTLIVRGLAELTRLGEVLGAKGATFDGLSGLARLLDSARRGSPNYRAGELVGKGLTGDELLKKAPQQAESLTLVGAVRRFGDERGIRIPMTATLDEIISGRISAGDVLKVLMGQGAD